MSSAGAVPWWMTLLSSRWRACEGTSSWDAETDWGVWGVSAHERVQGQGVWQLLDTWLSFWREMGWVRVSFRNTEPVIVSTAKKQKALMSPKTSAQVLVILSSPLE